MLFTFFFIAFDRTLPNLLGCLLSCRCPVHASEVDLFGAILNDVTTVAQNILPRASLFVGRVGRFKLYHSASCFAVCRTCWKVQALFKPFVGCIYKLQVKVMTFRDDVPFHFPFTAHRL